MKTAIGTRSGIRTLVALTGLALVLTGCSGQASTPDQSTNTTTNINKNAELTVGWASAPDTLNPATTGSTSVISVVSNVVETLVWLTPEGKVTPDLATSWKVGDGGKSYTFTLRKDVTFHDGTPFNAQAVVDNINYIAAPATKSVTAISLLGPCLTATAVSEFTVQLHCATAYAPLLQQLGTPALGIQSPAAITKYGADLGDHLVGTGPFEFVSYTPNQSIVLKRNPDYKWAPPAIKHKGPPNIAKITFHIVTDAQARVSEFQTGQSQYMSDTPGIFYTSLKSQPEYTAVPIPINGMGIFMPLNTQKWPTSELAVRKAIIHSINRADVGKLATGGLFPEVSTPLQKGTLGYDASLENSYPFSLKKAAAILKADGWTKPGKFWEKDGKTLTLEMTSISTSSAFMGIAQAAQTALIKAGMDVSLTPLAAPAWKAENTAGGSSLTPFSFTSVDPDGLHSLYFPGQFFNFSHYENPTLNALLRKGQSDVSSTRMDIYKQAQKLIVNEALTVPLYENGNLGMASSKLTGANYMGGGFLYFTAASLAK